MLNIAQKQYGRTTQLYIREQDQKFLTSVSAKT